MVAAGRHARDALVRSFFFQAEDGIRDFHVTGVQTCALPISAAAAANAPTVRCSSSWPSSTTASRYRYSPARNADAPHQARPLPHHRLPTMNATVTSIAEAPSHPQADTAVALAWFLGNVLPAPRPATRA